MTYLFTDQSSVLAYKILGLGVMVGNTHVYIQFLHKYAISSVYMSLANFPSKLLLPLFSQFVVSLHFHLLCAQGMKITSNDYLN